MDDKHPEALIIRTLPNSEVKKSYQYSGTNPPYLDPEICRYLCSINVKHLLIDLPSVDKEDDGGILKAHHEFWQFVSPVNAEQAGGPPPLPKGRTEEGGISDTTRKDCTITELIYVDNDVADGQYLLNLQITSMESDASPGKPILYRCET